jgi:hypothetical protein
VSAFELEALPLPSVSEMKSVENLLARNASTETIERRLRQLFLGETSA